MKTRTRRAGSFGVEALESRDLPTNWLNALTPIGLFVHQKTPVEIAKSQGRIFRVQFDAAQEIPTRPSPASGQASLILGLDGQTLRLVGTVSKVRSVSAVTIHLGGPTTFGPVVATLVGKPAPHGQAIGLRAIRST